LPLAFDSQSHGRIAFGFFNIETDLLLLENLFFFADDFCELLERLAAPKPPPEDALEGWVIKDRHKIGDLHGSIAGYNLSGFMGRVYELHPFPQDPAAFKQQPEGSRNREEMEGLLRDWAEQVSIRVEVADPGPGVGIGPFRFDRAAFLELVKYVWRGGMPCWQDGLRPDYVERMGQVLSRSRSGLFAGLSLA